MLDHVALAIPDIRVAAARMREHGVRLTAFWGRQDAVPQAFASRPQPMKVSDAAERDAI